MSSRATEVRQLASVWSAFGLQHPWIGHWPDPAWVRVLESTLASASGDDWDFERAVRTVVGSLDDPGSFVIDDAGSSEEVLPPGSGVQEIRPGVVAVRYDELDPAAKHVDTEVLVVDATMIGILDAELTAIAPLVQGAVERPGIRSRRTAGWTPQVTDYAYWAGDAVTRFSPFAGTADAAGPRLILVLPLAIYPMLAATSAGLAQAGAATIITGPGGLATMMPYPIANLVVRVRVAEVESPDISNVFALDRRQLPLAEVVAMVLDGTVPRPPSTRPNPSIEGIDSAPVAARQLASLCIAAETFETFHGPATSHEPWPVVLERCTDRLFARPGEQAWTEGLSDLAWNTADSHTSARWPGSHNDEGAPWPCVPVRAAWVDGLPVVVRPGPTDLRAGDVIVAVDGDPIAERVAARRRFQGASNEAAADYQALAWALDGPEPSTTITVQRDGGTASDVSASRGSVRQPIPPTDLPVWTVLPGGAGYIDLTRLERSDVERAIADVRDTKDAGLVLDMRGYPRGTAWQLAPLIATRSGRAAVFVTMVAQIGDTDRTTGFQAVEPAESGRYEGRVAVLIDVRAISQAEHSCLLFEAATDVLFVGTPTRGANGEVRFLPLPLDSGISFASMEVLHGDLRRLQQVGIQPHVRAEPTIAGLRAGRDEVLEAAVAALGR